MGLHYSCTDDSCHKTVIYTVRYAEQTKPDLKTDEI